ncbi:unnamed protein product [Brassicogethes aeneus]|uniref:Chloride channel CLIC-like protein 1 n=1 Tax=Brassicogethes aeneus TaxID=1431903 RepID=A0A9P0B4P0_BRAAE|nr:unnamed protein product [Brassicogethes aeneus]
MKHFVYLIYFFNVFILINCDWIDPHDMDIRAKIPKQESQNHKNPDLYKSCEIQSFKENNVNTNVFLKRVVGLIVNSAILEKEGEFYNGQIKINIAEVDFKFLKDFTSNADLNMNMLQKLDAILSEAFKKTMNDYYMETRNQILYMLLSETTVHIVCLTFILVFIYLMFKANFSLWYIVKYLLFIAWIYDAFVKYINLSEEFDIHNLKLMANKCNISSGTWADTWNYIFGYTECERKIISPFVVLEEQFKHIVAPLQYFGRGMGKFARELFVTLPWGFNIILMPIMLVFIGILFCTGFCFATSVPIKINLFHLFQLQFGEKKTIHRIIRQRERQKCIEQERRR